jgi:hypothetical protein
LRNSSKHSANSIPNCNHPIKKHGNHQSDVFRLDCSGLLHQSDPIRLKLESDLPGWSDADPLRTHKDDSQQIVASKVIMILQ